jgi:hypothetical protein
MLLTFCNRTGRGKKRQRKRADARCGSGFYGGFVANFAFSQYTQLFAGTVGKVRSPGIRWAKDTSGMLLNRDYVGYMAGQVIKKLVEDNLVEVKEKEMEPVIAKVRLRMMEEITVEDKINEEARTILTQHQDEMRRVGISYQDMFKKVKGQIARDRKLILR